MRLYLNLCVPVGGPGGMRAALEALVALDRVYLRSHPMTPDIYRAGIVYLRDVDEGDQGRPLSELWYTIPDVIASGGADCKCLAAWRVAALRELGEHADPWVLQVGPATWHVVVRRADGTMEDPSALLGMRGKG